MRELKPSVKSINGFMVYIKKIRKDKGSQMLIYRGLSNQKYKLIPHIARKSEKEKDKDKRMEFYPADEGTIKKRERFIRGRLAVRLPKFHDLHDIDDCFRQWRELFYAQHYGIPTRLMDFTRNPLIGLFFSVQNPNGESGGVVYAVRLRVKQDDYPEKINTDFIRKYNHVSYDRFALSNISPYNLPRSMFIAPPVIDDRIFVQESVFCCCSYTDPKTSDFEITDDMEYSSPHVELNKQKPFVNSKKGNMDEIIKIPIHKSYKEKIREKLNLMGVNYNLIYPDMEGLKKHIMWREYERFDVNLDNNEW